MKTISYATALRKFGVEADKRLPGHVTREVKAMYKRMCVEGLAHLAGYYIREA